MGRPGLRLADRTSKQYPHTRRKSRSTVFNPPTAPTAEPNHTLTSPTAAPTAEMHLPTAESTAPTAASYTGAAVVRAPSTLRRRNTDERATAYTEINCTPTPAEPDAVASDHARSRCAQRAIADEHIEIVLAWGADVRQRDGRVAYHLGVREASLARAEGVDVPASAVGVAVVIARDGMVVTAVRSHDRQRLRSHGWRSSRRRALAGR
jgi:hypothetical protein